LVREKKHREKRKGGETIGNFFEICDIVEILKFFDELHKLFEGGMEEERVYERF